MNCDDCPNYVNMGPNMVPWGETMVNEGDVWECIEGKRPTDCLDDSHHTVRSYNRRDEEQDWGDIQGHLDREDGR